LAVSRIVSVADAIGVKPQELSVDSAGEVPADVAAEIEARVARRVDREPMAYILGTNKNDSKK